MTSPPNPLSKKRRGGERGVNLIFYKYIILKGIQNKDPLANGLTEKKNTPPTPSQEGRNPYSLFSQ